MAIQWHMNNTLPPPEPISVVIVEHDRDRATAHRNRLADRYATQLVRTGSEAITAIDADTDVAIIEAELPDISGLAVIDRVVDAGVRPRFILLVEPDANPQQSTDVVDECLEKPITNEAIASAVDRLLTIDRYGSAKHQLSSDKLARNLLEMEHRPDELEDHPEYQQLVERIEELEAELERVETRVDPADLDRLTSV